MREAYGKCGGRRGSRDEENGKKKWGQLVCVGNGRGVQVLEEEEYEEKQGRKKMDGLWSCIGVGGRRKKRRKCGKERRWGWWSWEWGNKWSGWGKQDGNQDNKK